MYHAVRSRVAPFTNVHPFTIKLIAGVVLVNLLVTVFVGMSLFRIRQQYVKDATLSTQNLAQSVEINVSGTFEKIDRVLFSVEIEAEKQIANGGINREALNEYIAKQHVRLPEIGAIRVTNEQGEVVYGTGNPTISLANVSDRDYFRQLYENPEAGLVVSKPVIGRIAGKWMIALSRRISQPDGSIAGVVYSTVLMDYIDTLFSSLEIGKHGVIGIRDADLGLVTFFPKTQGKKDEIGSRILNHRLVELIMTKPETGTYTAVSEWDDIERTLTYQKIGPYPLYMFVGRATTDYLAPWYREIVRSLALLALFFLISAFSARQIYCRRTKEIWAMESLRQSEERFRVLIEHAPEAILVYDLDQDRYVAANLKAETLFGCIRAELMRKNIQFFYKMDPPDKQEAQAAVTTYVEQAMAGEKIDFETAVHSADGRNPTCEVHLVRLPSEQSRLLRISLIDITERRRARELLRASESKFRALADNSPLAICMATGIEQNAVYINHTFLTLFGYSLNELHCMAKWWPRAYPEEAYRSQVSEEWQRRVEYAIETESDMEPMETFVTSKDGSVKNILWDFRIVGNDTIAFGLDLTELRRTEAQLHQSQKMESLGRLAAGIAHDFNNMLSIILGAAELSLTDTPEESGTGQHLMAIKTAAERSRDITRQLLAFSRKGIIEPKPISLNAQISTSQKNMGRLIGEDVTLTFHPDPASDLWKVKIDPSQLDQILMNLVANARDAMPDGGALTFETANISIHDEYNCLYTKARPGDYIQLTVSDTGCGMDRETREHIFEPFFTTKNVGKGTGLGLATVYGIITQNNGFINCYSEPGQGTVFRIYFPRLMEDDTVVEKQTVPVTAYTISERILLVDDEELLLSTTTKLLEKIGYTVIQAQSPEEAISICKQGDQQIDLILTDVVMPGINGREMVDRIKIISPEVKVLFMSGYTSDMVAQRGIVEEGMHYINKPFSMNQLKKKIKDTLEHS
ncbi:MAG: PAS domain S-box protein [Desulfocapsaceae bacterium]|nr:PAS domain S-box protein [Desulfocapsaceae bacterium]